MKKQDTQKIVDSVDEKVTALEADVQAARNEAEEWKTKCMRAIADYQNLQRRNTQERESVYEYASELLMGRLLPAIDTLEMAKKHLNDVGLDLAFKAFLAILDEKAVVKIQTIGEAFDPHTMECIDTAEGEDNIVLEELLPGYTMNGKVLRVAQVKVGKKQ